MTVVVGVDGSPGSHAAIRLALQEARCRGESLTAIMAYGGESVAGAPAARPLSTLTTATEQLELTQSALEQVIGEALADDAPQVRARVVQGLPGRALIEAAHSTAATLIVLSARRDGTVSRLLGAVSQYVLRNAPCPVLVVPYGR
jgi:nucleotide-binding universal stress UspA family protein